MEESQNRSRKRVMPTILRFAIAGIVLVLLICPLFRIHLFTLGMTNEYTDRVDCIEGYYVAVYNNEVCHFTEDGKDCLAFGNIEDITDFDWKHRELLGIVPFRRFLCFSVKCEEELYALTNEAGTVRYGLMYVLRTDSVRIHYYFRRDNPDSTLVFAPVLYREKVSFSCDGIPYELKDDSFFTADIDFTKNEPVLRICDRPCWFVSLAQETGADAEPEQGSPVG